MTKKIALLNTSLEGGVAKSTTSMGQIEAARQAGKSVSITLLDKDHKPRHEQHDRDKCQPEIAPCCDQMK